MRSFKNSLLTIVAAAFVLTGLSACFHEECHVEQYDCHQVAYNCGTEAFDCHLGCNMWATSCEDCDRYSCWPVPCYDYCVEEIEFCDYREVCDYHEVCAEREVCEFVDGCFDDFDCPSGYYCSYDGYCR